MNDKTELDIAALMAKASEDPKPVDPTAETAPADEAPADPMFQQYTSSRIATCFITTAGLRANFTNYEYYTSNPAIIAYLDEEIANGNRQIKKGERVTREDINPAAALKRKHIAEFLESQEGRDFTASQKMAKLVEEGKVGGAGTGTVTTSQVAN